MLYLRFRRHTGSMRVRCPVVIGREAELAAIAGLIAGSGAGHGGVLFLLVSRAYASRRCCGLPSPMFNRRIWAGSIQARGRADRSVHPRWAGMLALNRDRAIRRGLVGRLVWHLDRAPGQA